MDFIKFTLPELTFWVGVRAPDGYDSYFKTETLPRLLELGFVLETEFKESPIYYKEKFTEKEKEDFINLFENSKYIAGMFVYYAHKSNKETKEINVIFWKLKDYFKIETIKFIESDE